MKSTGPVLIVVAAVLAIGAYVEREALLPYAPAWLSGASGATTSAEPGESKGQGQGAGSQGRPSGSAGGQKSAAVRVAVAHAGSLPIRFATTGNVVAVASTVLNSEAVGTVAAIAVKDGAPVGKGQLIVQLDDRSAKALVARDQASVAKDQAALADAQVSLQRIASLVKSGASTRQAGDDAMAAVREAQGSVSVDQAALDVDRVALSKTRITSPFDGRLGAFSVSVGALVQPGTAIVTVTQVKPVYLQFSLPETWLAKAQAAMAKGALTVDAAPALPLSSDGPEPAAIAADAAANGGTASAASNGDPAARNGKVVFIDNAVDPVSATFKLRAELENADNSLLPGQSLDVDVTLGDIGDLVLVPSVAVEPQADSSVAYVVGTDNKVTIRTVTVALRVGDLAGLTSGISAGDRVVVEGQGGLIDKAAVKVVDPASEAGDKKPEAKTKPGTGTDEGSPLAENGVAQNKVAGNGAAGNGAAQ